jgi:hypothetical protein
MDACVAFDLGMCIQEYVSFFVLEHLNVFSTWCNVTLDSASGDAKAERVLFPIPSLSFKKSLVIMLPVSC